MGGKSSRRDEGGFGVGEDRQPVDHRSPRPRRQQVRRHGHRLPRGFPRGAGWGYQGHWRSDLQNHESRSWTRRDCHGQRNWRNAEIQVIETSCQVMSSVINDLNDDYTFDCQLLLLKSESFAYEPINQAKEILFSCHTRVQNNDSAYFFLCFLCYLFFMNRN